MNVPENIVRRVDFFKKRFETYGEDHFIFACHASFPVIFTPDLLYRIWLNFNVYQNNNINTFKKIDPIVVSDLLLSNLCYEIGFELYEMNKLIRSYLMNELRNDRRFGEQRLRMLADFLYQYATVAYKHPDDQHFKDTHQWTALAIANPQQVVFQIGKAMSQAIEQEKTGELLRLYMLLETFVKEDKTFDQLFEYSKGVKEHIFGNTDYVVRMPVLTTKHSGNGVNLLTLPIPESLRGKIEKSKGFVDKIVADKIRNAKEQNTTLLDLSNMGLVEIPDGLFDLEQLQRLNLSNNNIISLSVELIKLKQLQVLNLKDNQLTELPKEITELNLEIKWKDDGNGGIILEGNPIETPPIEIVLQGREALRSYFISLSENEKLPFNEARFFVLGDSGVGKSSLLKRIISDKYKPESEPYGMIISTMDIKIGTDTVKVKFWDFGGHDILHSTFRFFLSHGLYMFVLDARKETNIEYWLELIERFSNNSQILIVMSKTDINSNFNINRKNLQEKYKSIKGFYRVSSKTGEGMEELTQVIKTSVEKSEFYKTMLPLSWFNLKKQLENMNDNFISYERYKELCLNANIYDEKKQSTFLSFLHDFGILLYFKELLDDTIILKPEWLPEAIYNRHYRK